VEDGIIIPEFITNRGISEVGRVIGSGKGRLDLYANLQPTGVEAGDYVHIDKNAPKLRLVIKDVMHYLISAAHIIGTISQEDAEKILKKHTEEMAKIAPKN